MAQAKGIKTLTTSQAPLVGRGARCPTPIEAAAAAADAVATSDSNTCKVPAAVSAHLVLLTLGPVW